VELQRSIPKPFRELPGTSEKSAHTAGNVEAERNDIPRKVLITWFAQEKTGRITHNPERKHKHDEPQRISKTRSGIRFSLQRSETEM
jgi:hypothetical protein